MTRRPPDGALARYGHIRDGVVDDLRFMGELVQRDREDEGDDQLSQTVLDKIDDRVAALQDGSLGIGVFGETCSGKSTLINALSRREVTRPDVVSNTGVVMEFVYSKQERLSVQFADGRSEQISWEDVPLFTDQQHNPENSKGVAYVRGELPVDYLSDGVKFFDTPGLNDVVKLYGDLALQQLDTMGALVVTSLYPPFTRGEMEFLKRASHKCDKLFVVVNLSADYWEERDRLREKVCSNITRDPDLREHPDLQPKQLRVYVLNARWAWEGVKDNDQEKLEQSGFQEFRQDLEEFLARDAGRYMLASSIRGTFEVVALLQRLLTLRSEILYTERSDVEKKIEAVQRSRKEAELKKYELFDMVDSDVESLLEVVLPEIEGIVDATADKLTEIRARKVFGGMVEELEELYRTNISAGAAVEEMISKRVETIFQAARGWVEERLEDLFQATRRDLPERVGTRDFSFSRSQKALLGLFEGYADSIGLAEAVVGVTTVGATMAAGGQGIAFLSGFLGPLAFPLGGLGGFLVGVFARNFMKVREVRTHIDLQLREIEGSRELLPDKLRVVLERVSSGIKSWVNEHFEQVFTRISAILEEHRENLSEEGYIEKRRRLLETRQEELDAVRDRFLERLEEIRALIEAG